MNLAIEYLARSAVVKQAFKAPISLYLNHKKFKLVITIRDELPSSNYYTVNHWNLSNCNSNQVLPSISEFRVPKEKLFSHHATILSECMLLKYTCECVPSEANEKHTPIMHDIYSCYFDGFSNNLYHREAKVNWLWDRFIEIYFPEISSAKSYINQSYSVNRLAEKQRTLVMKKKPKIWSFWKKWHKYMLFPEFIPGELVFANEYD